MTTANSKLTKRAVVPVRRAIGSGLAALGVAGVLSSCAGLVGPVVVGVGAAAYDAYRRGEYGGYVDVPIERCDRAVRAAAGRLRLQLVRCRRSGVAVTFLFRNGQGTPFWVTTDPLTPDSTRVVIRAGIWGESVCSAKLLAEIRETARATAWN